MIHSLLRVLLFAALAWGSSWGTLAQGVSETSNPLPSAGAKRSAAELEKLVAPIALYPDPLVATVLAAAVYPLEIVQAARFIEDPRNLAKVESQPWDTQVKELTKVPAVLKQLNADLSWTVDLGQAFLAQPQEIMEAIQSLRQRAKELGNLKTTSQQIVIVTNAIVEKTYETQVVYVTNTVVEIQPANPQIIYVPVYNPAVVYVPPPLYVNPLAPVITFGAGIAVGAIIANNCDWHYGGIYYGRPPVVIVGPGRPPYYPPPPGFRPPPYHPPPGYRPPPPGHRPPGVPPPGQRPPPGGYPGQPRPRTVSSPPTGQRWQPDSARLRVSGSSATSSPQSRGWSSPSGPTTRPAPSPGKTAPSVHPVPAPKPRPVPGGSLGSPQRSTRPMPTTRPAPPSHSPGGSRTQESAFKGGSGGAKTQDFSNRGSASRGSPSGAKQGEGGGATRGGHR